MCKTLSFTIATNTTLFLDFRIKTNCVSVIKTKERIDQDLSYGEILADRPEAWVVKKNILLCMQSQNVKNVVILKFKIISRTSFVLKINLIVMSKEPVLMFVMVAPTLKKNN